jgi:glycosyltransferase involved in cell wall biosynthesis
MTPFFSIILPTYNRVNFLEASINSVIDQTFENWELIVVDDGSTDNTKELVESFEMKDSRVNYFYQKNSERCIARNSGIEKAKGEFICFLDSDDWYEEKHLQGIHEFVSQSEVKQAFFYTNFKVNGVIQGRLDVVPKEIKLLTNYLLNNSIIPDRVCIHATILEKYRFDVDITIGEDAMLWARIAQCFEVIGIEQCTVDYRLHSDNTINIKNDSPIKLLNGLKVYFLRYPEVHKNLLKSDIDHMLGNIYFNIAKYHIYKLNRYFAVRALLYSLVLNSQHKQSKYKLNLILKILLGKISSLNKEVE